MTASRISEHYPEHMRNPTSALESGHDYAARAERLEISSEFGRAAEMAKRASDSYGKAVEETNVPDASVKTTMVKLQEDWARRSKDLQRKADYASRQPSRSSSLSRGASRTPSQTRRTSGGDHDSEIRTKARANGIDRLESAMNGSIGSGSGGGAAQKRSEPLPGPPPDLTPPGESFMMLAGSDPSDPFNQFWTILQGMLENFSAPVAWATVPLNGEPAPERLVASGSMSGSRTRASGNVRPPPAHLANSDDSETFSDDGDDDFYLVMPASPNSNAADGSHSYPPARVRTQEELYYENIALKQTVDTLSHQLQAAEQALRQKQAAEQANVRRLQGSLLDVRQLMQASILGMQQGAGAAVASPTATQRERELRPSDTGAVSPRLPPKSALSRTESAGNVSVPTAKEADEQREKDAEKEKKKREEELEGMRQKLKDAEEEATRLRIENEKNMADAKKYRDRWDKVKEAAKKKKEAKEAAAAGIAEVGVAARPGLPGASASGGKVEE
ncbi:hypothetical protein CALCODRAFT_499657 [Calocera cornea HHB12733]|uniref:Uncharacterized protein n=1 Tax=Calocera cornea HHB12733 TaxID=1353952 RepID=A0A165ED03_9BASI|nr:hypothetical protein CALCODRAFT_499657 [Calocera cornea HHB12733]